MDTIIDWLKLNKLYSRENEKVAEVLHNIIEDEGKTIKILAWYAADYLKLIVR
jgi:hypothetical protein